MSSSADPKLPQDVVLVEILKRLPVESLLRFRCVSRSWRSTIDDPRFVALHLNHSAHDASKRYLLRLDLWHPVHRPCSLFPNLPLALPSHSQIEIPFVNPLNRYSLVGSCNGSICVKEYPRKYSGNDGGRTMYLWNLFTRKHKAVPRPGPRHRFPSTAEALGFGFDARSNDYKILRILYFLDNNDRWLGGTMPQVRIYSLSTDSWRSLECEVPAFCGYRLAVFLNGNLHWFASKVNDLGEDVGYGPIVLFDVAGEVFDEMAPPLVEISQLDTVDLMMSVAVLNDLLAVFVSLLDIAGDWHSVCSVRVMREYGVTESWIKLYSFEAWGGISHFDGFMRNGELVMVIDDEERVSWNPIMGQYTNLPLPTYCHLVNVVESLVSPQR
ncbi:F-box protein At3g07870-like isoform X2 [Rhodamnia argentea]|uniref:F-box protein At3g07870-like isoform X2 n=1 Tax=Rhodamnia argentea TaxID=178133 RepID=A0A8B8Q987_9MYRT|nr:F-box protein At3g07870-like isoform X2 [Rhodamnia argentea]